MNSRIQELVAQLHLAEHPEGGFYKETFRSSNENEGRAVLSSIYYLLYSQHVSHFHTIDADEAWYHHEGGILHIHTFHPKHGYRLLQLGNYGAEAAPFHIVEAGTIFGSCLANENDYALVSCAVAPAFEFAHFVLNTREELLKDYPEQKEIICKLTR